MKTLILDTSYLIYRSYFAYPLLTSNGQNTGALFGFIKTVMALVKEFEPDNIVFACDLPEKTWRHEILDDYKAGRPEIDIQMREQFPYILEWCNLVTPNVLSKSGFEADDIIFTVCLDKSKKLQEKVGDQDDSENLFNLNEAELETDENQEFYIFSSDRDLYQMLILPNIKFVSQHKGITSLFGLKEFEEKYGLLPHQWVDFKALVGDNSDNLKGVSGIGPKTATKILQEVTSLQLLFEVLNVKSSITGRDGFTDDQRAQAETYAKDPKNARIIEKIQAEKTVVEQTYLLATLQKVPETKVSSEVFDFVRGLPVVEKFHFTSLIRALKPGQKIPMSQPVDENALF